MKNKNQKIIRKGNIAFSIRKSLVRIMSQSQCDACVYNEYDEEEDTCFCTVNLDEDEMGRFLHDSHFQCPYFQLNDEYRVVRKQM